MRIGNHLSKLVTLLLLASSLEALAFYNPQTGRWLNRDPINEHGGKNLYGFSENRAINISEWLGLSVTTLVGPEAAIDSWIASFDPNFLDPIEFLDAYSSLPGASINSSFLANLSIALDALASSANAAPSSVFDPGSMESRGSVSMQVSITCGCDGRIRGYDAKSSANPGYTPAPLGIYLPGQGNNSLSCSVAGTSIYCQAFARSRVGAAGQAVAAMLFPAAGVPYRWSQIEYVFRCDKTYSINYSSSYFPSHIAYLNGQSVATSSQSGLAAFMFAGSGVDAPGGQFHSASGAVP